ncbi:MAG TPA: hypothetical protein VKB46_11785 [Pyrinomonadaceae bacterium]|nr:hypothetical protein [Pyrinomonadaceae bacterium]
MRLRLSIIPVACLALVLTAAANAYAQTQTTITQEKALAILNAVDKATRGRNLAGIMAPLASDVKIKLTVTGPGREKEINMTRAQYESQTRQALRTRFGYDCERKNVRVKIFGDGQSAMVSDDFYETLTASGKTVRSITAETTIFYVRQGRIVITSMEGRLRFY